MNPMASERTSVSQKDFTLPSAKTGNYPKASKNRQATLADNSTPEEWIEACFELEASSATSGLEHLWEKGLAKFTDSAIFLEAYSHYLYRRKRYHKVLELTQPLLKKSTSLTQLKIGMSSAYALSQFKLAWNMFSSIHSSHQEQLEDDLLSQAATSAMMISLYKEAESVLLILRQRYNAPELPSLEESLLEQFGSHDKRMTWMQSVSQKIGNGESLKKISLSQLVTYASALMFEGKYKEALKMLTSYKEMAAL